MNTKKLFILLAAVLLSSVSAMAQSGNNEPLKGDVNEDGTVDVADIAALIAIIKNNSAPQTVYYWYVGATNPSSIGTLVSGTNTIGWHEIGTSTSGFNIVFNNQNKIEFDDITQYYLIIPNNLHVYAADGNTLAEGAVLNSVTCNIANHKAFQYRTTVYSVKGLVIK